MAISRLAITILIAEHGVGDFEFALAQHNLFNYYRVTIRTELLLLISQALLLICAIFTYLVREIGQKAFQGSVFNTTRLLYMLIIYILSREIQLSYYSNTIKDRKVGLAVLP